MPASVPFVLRKLFFQLALGGFVASSLASPAIAQNASPTPAAKRSRSAAANSTPPPFEYVPVKKAGFIERIFKKKPTPQPTPNVAPTVAPATPKPTPRKKKRNAVAASEKTPTPPSPDPSPGDSAIQNSEPTPAANIEPNDASAAPALNAIGAPLNATDAGADSPTLAPVEASVGDRLPDSLPPLSGGITSPQSLPTPLPGLAPIPEAPSATVPVVTTSAPTQAVRNNPLNQPIPLLSESAGAETVSVPSPEALREKESLDRIQFRKVKARALEDASLQKLQQATETAATPEERYAALKKFYPKLFAAMRKIDGNLSVQIDEMEAAARRRLERLTAEAAQNPAPAR